MSCSPDSERYVEPDQHHQLPRRQSQNEWLGVGLQHPELGAVESPPPEASSHHICHYTPKCFLTVHRGERDVQLMPHLFSLHPTPTAPPRGSFLKVVPCTGGHGTSARSTPTRGARSTPSRFGEEGWHEGTTKTTIRAENEVEAHREANNYKVGHDTRTPNAPLCLMRTQAL